MKKSLILGIVSLAASVATSYGQRVITLDNYSSQTDPMLIYGPDTPANGISGMLGSGGLINSWTVGLYWAAGTTGLSQAAGFDLPDVSLTLGTGGGSTVVVATQNALGMPGYYGSITAFNIGPSTTVTLEIVVYDTAAGSYANAAYRVHSAAFSMPTVSVTSGSPIYTGDYMPGQLFQTPEPTTLALGGLGLASLLLFRRKQS